MSFEKALCKFRSIDLSQMRKAGFLQDNHKALAEKMDRVHAKSGWVAVTACPLCQSKDKTTEFQSFGIDIVKCLVCDLRYSSQAPKNTNDVYSDKAYLPLAQKSYLSNSDYRSERFGKERLDIIRRYFPSLNGVRLLDVGCGTGWFLNLAKEAGLLAEGQELGEELGNWTAKQLDLRVWTGPLTSIDKNSKYDVITMFDVLEHVPSPVDLIESAKHLLNEDGILLIFTPNFDSLAIRIMGEKSNLVTPAEHLTYFTSRSVAALAEKTNLKVEELRSAGIDLGDLKSYFESENKKAYAAFCEEFYDLLQPLVDEAGAGNHLRFVLRAP